MNLVAFEMFADAIRPGHQTQNVSRALQIEKPFAFGRCDLTAVQHPLAQVRDAREIATVNGFQTHG